MKAFVWAPANNGTDLTQKHKDLGIKRLKKMGYDVILDDNMSQNYLGLGINEPSKLIDFYKKFIRTDHSVLIPIYGGFTSNFILEDIVEISSFKENQLVCGKSDLTCLLNSLYQKTGMNNVYGIDLSKICNPNLTSEEIKIIERSLKKEEIVFDCPLSYNDGYWYISERTNFPHHSWSYFYSEEIDSISGSVVGGNLESLCSLLGTRFSPNFKDKIVVIETIPDVSPRKFLMNIKQLIMGSNVLQAKALIIGKFSPQSILNHDFILYQLLVGELKMKNFPIIFNIDFSHTEPSFPFYTGGFLEINFSSQKMRISCHS
ncbi:hypothetical protein HOO54_16320 [Bacillus sp. WMMC1349]|uniref:LD-carboxypeptidase n=1 Tax=Bacillus sp. WMMC1349 TaxID=2736254 RepID=UPI0015572F4C|nr:LD-carboxypeptidase [Bacillus sp. WMMC1349]NPC93757.1 hypothetical protein [Bacillus sp. WMMC1349]